MASTTRSTSATAQALPRTHLLLGALSALIVLGSINRLSPATTGYVLANEFLRWVDLINMLVIPLGTVIVFLLLARHLTGGARAPLWLDLAFITSVYLLAVSYGDHEVTNYLHIRFCPDPVSSPICRIIVFNDDDFSHWLFFAGFSGINVVMLLLQRAFPHSGALSRRDTLLLLLNSVFIALGVIANLAFEEIGLDLYVVIALALFAGALWLRARSQPLNVYYAVAYWVGLAGTVAVRAMTGR